MKKITLLISAALLFVTLQGCKDAVQNQEDDKPATLIISIAGTSGTRAAGTPVATQENAVNEFTVYIFNANSNLLERSVTSTVNPTTRIENLHPGQKRVVVLANFGANYPAVNVGDSYTTLASSTLAMYDMPTTIATAGLPISGEAAISLTSGINNESITVSRMVARVELGNVTVNVPDAGIAGVSINRVMIMKGRSSALVTAPSTDTYLMDPSASYLGGMTQAGLITTTAAAYYSEAITPVITSTGAAPVTENPDIYFYVFPNNGTTQPTLLTLVSNDGTTDRYFPIQLNDGVTGTGTGGDTDGTFIKRNSIYILNITLQHHESGTTGPEDTPANMVLTVNVADWALPIEQNVVWE